MSKHREHIEENKALAAERDAATKDAASWRAEFEKASGEVFNAHDERDAALTRAEKAEAQLFDWTSVEHDAEERADAAEARVRELEAIDDGGRDIAYALKQARERVRELEERNASLIEKGTAVTFVDAAKAGLQRAADHIATLEAALLAHHDALGLAGIKGDVSCPVCALGDA